MSMDNLSNSRKEVEEIKTPSISKTPKQLNTTNTEKFKLGSIVTMKNKTDFGTGVVFKEVDEYNYWVAFHQKENERISSAPCLFDVLHHNDLILSN